MILSILKENYKSDFINKEFIITVMKKRNKTNGNQNNQRNNNNGNRWQF